MLHFPKVSKEVQRFEVAYKMFLVFYRDEILGFCVADMILRSGSENIFVCLHHVIDLVEVGTLSPHSCRIFEGKPTPGTHSWTCPIELKF